MSELRVVAVTYSPGDQLTSFLSSLGEATTRSYEVVLADNGSTDGSPEAAALADPKHVSVTRTGGNLGYGGAANIGAGGASADWLLISNPDIVFSPDSIDRLIAAADRWPQGGAFGPLIRTPSGELYPSARAQPTLGRGIGHALFGWCWPSNPWTASYRRERGEPLEGPCGWLSGSVFLVRPKAWVEVGGFDTSYFMYFEDVDLGRRLTDAGWTNVYVPDAVVTHDGGHATKKAPKVMLKAHHDSALKFLSRRYRGPLLAPVRLLLRLGLWVHFQLSARIVRMGEGAAPTRSHDRPET